MKIENIRNDNLFYKSGIFIKNIITNEIKYYSYIKSFNKEDLKNLKENEIFIEIYNNNLVKIIKKDKNKSE